VYARIITSTIPAERLGQATAAIQATTRRTRLRDAPGFQHAYWLYDHDGCTLTSVVVFDTQEDEQAAWELACDQVVAGGEHVGGTPETRGCDVIYNL
jgi:hypothetical protein